MLIKVVKYFLLITVSLTLIGFVSWKIYVGNKIRTGKKYYLEIRNAPKYYCYDLTSGALNPSFYITDLKYKDALKDYYDSLKHKGTPYVPFSPTAFGVFKPIFFLGYPDKNDSLIAEVLDFDTTCYGYIHAYVYGESLHKTSPPENLAEQFKATWDSLKQSSEYKMKTNAIFHSSPYGVQCD